MKLTIIELLNAKNEKRILDGFRFILDNKVYQYYENKDIIKNFDDYTLGGSWKLENILDKEIEIITPDLIKMEQLTQHNNLLKNKNSITKEDIDNILSKTFIIAEKYDNKTTVIKATLPNGFVIVESSSCIDPNNFDMAVGEQICMKKIEDKIWELEGYRLQCELGEN